MNSAGTYKKNDKNYLGNHDQYTRPKETFKTIMQVLKKIFGDQPISLCDAGCASGAFLYYAHQELNLTRSIGFDISEKLIEQAKFAVPQSEFLTDSVLELKQLKEQQFDVVVCLGTLSIFEDITPALKNLHALLAKGGFLITCDLVNDFPIDVITRFKDVNSNQQEWRSAFNVRSKVTYEKEFKAIDPDGKLQFIDFQMPFALPKTEDPLRAWTIQTEENNHQLRVGTGQLLNHKIVQFQKSGGS